MNKLEKQKQLDDIICNETNVKIIKRFICTTEKGEIYVAYKRAAREYVIMLNKKEIKAHQLLKATLKQLYEM